MGSKANEVHVGSLPFDATEEELVSIFSRVGPVRYARPMVNRDTNQPRGYGFVGFATREGAVRAAQELNNMDMRGRRLKVTLVEANLPTAAPSSGGAMPAAPQMFPPGGMRPMAPPRPPMMPPPPGFPFPPGMMPMQMGGMPDPMAMGMLPPHLAQQFAAQQARAPQQQQQQPLQPQQPTQQLPPPQLAHLQPPQQPQQHMGPQGAAAPPPDVSSLKFSLDSLTNEQAFDLLKQMKHTPPEQVRALLEANEDLTLHIVTALVSCGLVDANVLQALYEKMNTEKKPAPVEPTPPPEPTGDALAAQQQALLKMVMELKPEDIESLPPEQRQQILLLRSQFMNQG